MTPPSRRRHPLFAVLALPLVVGIATGAFAQERKSGSGSLPNSYQGLGVSSDDPIQFEAESLEVREQDQMALFTGNVVVRQKDTVLKTDKLTVYYEGSVQGQGKPPAATGQAAAPARAPSRCAGWRRPARCS